MGDEIKIDLSTESNVVEPVIEPVLEEEKPVEVLISKEYPKVNEAFVTSYNLSLNDRERMLVLREKAVAEFEKNNADILKLADEKQALISSKIAKNTEQLKKIEEQLELLAAKEASLKLREINLNEREEELALNELDLVQRQSYSNELINGNEEIKKQLELKKLEMDNKLIELAGKQAEIDRLNIDIALQKRENDAMQKKIQRLINLNNLEREELK